MSLPPDTSPARRTITIDVSRLPSAVTAIGVGLVFTVVILATSYAREHGDLDGSVFTLGVVASLGLLAIAIVSELKAPGLERRAAMTSWPGAAGIAGVGLMAAVLIGGDSSVWVAPPLVLALSVGGYLVRPASPFVLTGLAALAILYARLAAEVVPDGDDALIGWGAALVVFVVGVTTLGWLLLPSRRVLIGLVTGAFSLFALSWSFFFPFFFLFGDGYDELDGSPVGNPLENDAYVLIGYCAALLLFWAACAIGSGHVGFRVLIVVAAGELVPMALGMLRPSHPSGWQLGLGVVGGLALLVAALRAPGAGEVTAAPEP